ncbi:MAG TPA: N-acetylneuraminate synthase family protein [Kofleriaceae bacterium]|nr:N-acetylneuraminate synthase family protein [Kofleriaceae bacterium]
MPFTLPASRCYVIAEAGSTHDGRLDQARRLIDVAAEAGADAVKFQVFRARRLYARGAGASDYLGDPRSIYDIVAALEMPPDWLPVLAGHAAERRIDFLASAFDEESVDLVDPWVAAHKCASYEMTHHPLLAHMAAKGKPLLVSTGAARMDEVADAVEVVRATGAALPVLLQCTASYPTPIEELNLRAMRAMADAFGVQVGLSDHSRHPTIGPSAAVALGACVVEKHYTLSNYLPGPDHRFALEPRELAAMVAAVRATESALGKSVKAPAAIEDELRQFARRSIYTVGPVRRGEALTADNIAVLRCGKLAPGLPPAAYPALLGRAAARDLQPDHAIGEEDVRGA